MLGTSSADSVGKGYAILANGKRKRNLEGNQMTQPTNDGQTFPVLGEVFVGSNPKPQPTHTKKKEKQMSNTRAKFSCVQIEPHGGEYKIVMTPVYSGSEENRKFFAFTPGGKIELQVVGSDTASQFRTGHDYYVDFTEVPE